MEKLLAKHWAGWLNPQNMVSNPSWVHIWAKQAKEALEQGNELVIIKIPKNSGALEAIERMLQKDFPLNSK